MKRIISLAAVVAALWTAAGVAVVQAWPEVERPAHAAVRYTPPQLFLDGGVTLDRAEVEAELDRITQDPRGWRTDLGHLTVRIVKPGEMGTQRMPGAIGAAYIEQQFAVVTEEAWVRLGPRFASVGGSLADQRAWIVLHEIGHLLAGNGEHAECTGAGPAPVMRADNYRLNSCTYNIWPNP